MIPRTRHRYIYIYYPFDNRYGFSLTVGNTKNHIATLTCLEWHTEICQHCWHVHYRLIDNLCDHLYLKNGSFKFEVDPHQINLSYFSQFPFNVKQKKKIFKSWQVCVWLARWFIMLGFMDLRWPRISRHSNVGLVNIILHVCLSILKLTYSQIPQCICPISHNAPFYKRNVHMCAHFSHKMVHCGTPDWCIVGFVRWVCYCMV